MDNIAFPIVSRLIWAGHGNTDKAEDYSME